MAYIFYNKPWQSEFHGVVSRRDKLQDKNINQIKPNLLGDLVELHRINESLKNRIGSYNEKWLEESKTKLLKQIDDKKRAQVIMSRMKKQMNKH